ncbi:MAG TPA: oxygen-independent coproporphyrinogen III oxidase, partial [Lamprocystis sp. (in: g-proteobacteria)]|nr:oxygen-independent coproporphyrinogen III oxidase [Lamprocystis sp. (in: g-proteobacteria)]
HLPFCPVRCLYCACHTTVTHDSERIDRYLDTLELEMDLVTDHLGRGRALSQLYLGGGTPNYLSDSQLIRLMDMLTKRFRVAAETVTTIECSPRRASAGQLELLKGLGFTRLSFGIQDLDARVQQAIGRVNSLGLVRDVYDTARTIGFENISLDLIYGLPKQSVESFESTLARVIEIAPDRVRCFSYSHSPAARPHQYAIETGGLPGAQDKLTLLHSAVRCFTEAGYHWLGVDCFARDGDDLVDAKAAGTLRHTCLGYTSAATRHLVGLGSSSLGEVDRVFIQNRANVDAWRKDLEAGRFPIQCGYRMSDADRRHRNAMHLLMCNLEVPASLASDLQPECERLNQWQEHGLVEIGSDCIKVTQRGRYFLRSLCTPHEVSVAWSSNQWGVPPLS